MLKSTAAGEEDDEFTQDDGVPSDVTCLPFDASSASRMHSLEGSAERSVRMIEREDAHKPSTHGARMLSSDRSDNTRICVEIRPSTSAEMKLTKWSATCSLAPDSQPRSRPRRRREGREAHVIHVGRSVELELLCRFVRCGREGIVRMESRVLFD